MPQDVKLTQDANKRFDMSIANGDFEGVDGLDTSLYVSLGSDARASDAQVAVPEKRRGWPGNMASPVKNRQLGGLLWLIDQRRLTQETLNDTIDYARGSLWWMIEDGLLLALEVSGIIVPRSGIQLEIITTAHNGQTETRYYKLWEVTGVGGVSVSVSPAEPNVWDDSEIWNDSEIWED